MLFKNLGTDTTSVIRMFLTQAVANNGFPFEIRKNSKAEHHPYEMMTEEEMLAKLKRSREHCEEGRYREADQVLSDLGGSMDYKVIVTEDAETDMHNFVQYYILSWS